MAKLNREYAYDSFMHFHSTALQLTLLLNKTRHGSQMGRDLWRQCASREFGSGTRRHARYSQGTVVMGSVPCTPCALRAAALHRFSILCDVWWCISTQQSTLLFTHALSAQGRRTPLNLGL